MNKFVRLALVVGIFVGIIGFAGAHQLARADDVDDNIVWGT
jgi:hypothetical protein